MVHLSPLDILYLSFSLCLNFQTLQQFHRILPLYGVDTISMALYLIKTEKNALIQNIFLLK